MGIHSGPVNEVTDLNEQANIAGAGINIAQRVMDCGDAGHILISKRVADDLEHYPQWRSLLHELGECEVKHGLRISLLNLYDENAGNPELPAKMRQNEEERKTITSDASARREEGFWVAVLPFKYAGANTDLSALAQGLVRRHRHRPFSLLLSKSHRPQLNVAFGQGLERFARRRQRAGCPLRDGRQLASGWGETASRRSTGRCEFGRSSLGGDL